MQDILKLREKRARTWDQAKAFLDSKRTKDGLLSAEDTATYEKMEGKVVALGKEIDRLERQAQIDAELNRNTSVPITAQPGSNNREAGCPTAGGRDAGLPAASVEYAQAFWNIMRNPQNAAPGVHNSLRVGQDADGGYLVPTEFEARIIQALEEENALRGLANVITTSSGDRKIPVEATRGTASWVDEEGAIPESAAKFDQVTIGAYKLATLIKVSEELLSDSAFDMEAYIAHNFGRRMGSREEEAFLVGDGKGKPTGVFADVGGGELGATTSAATITIDDVLDLFYGLKSPYRRNATFVMHDTTVKTIRKLTDKNGQYLWQPSIKAGEPDRILGRPLVTSAYAPEMKAGNKAIAFGDFGYYWVADRQGRVFKRLNELYATTGQVGFLCTQRVDGKLVLPEAMKLLKVKGGS